VLIGGRSIGASADVYNAGKGTIVDSGTTDTFLPRQCADKFKEAFHAVTGTHYSTELTLTKAQVRLRCQILMMRYLRPPLIQWRRGATHLAGAFIEVYVLVLTSWQLLRTQLWRVFRSFEGRPRTHTHALTHPPYTCARATKQAEALPTMTFVFAGGARVDMPASSYVEALDDSNTSFRPFLFLTESEGAILGASFMRNKDVIFDKAGMRWAHAHINSRYSIIDLRAAKFMMTAVECRV
jgi:Eukaryotic aspartyl protease